MVSWPGIRGNLAMNSPSWMCRSVPQTPHACQANGYHSVRGWAEGRRILALTLIKTSPGRILGRGTSTMLQSSGFSYLCRKRRLAHCYGATANKRKRVAQLTQKSIVEATKHENDKPESLHGLGELICHLDSDEATSDVVSEAGLFERSFMWETQQDRKEGGLWVGPADWTVVLL